MGKSGQFRSDPLLPAQRGEPELPTLRDRREDILLLFEHFLQQSSLRFDRPAPELDRATVASLMAHDWPGNVRELRNVAERFALGLPVFNKAARPYRPAARASPKRWRHSRRPCSATPWPATTAT